MNILHVLNGDATLAGFEQTGLDGDVVVWRGVLSEGPLEENIASAHFWKARAEWVMIPFNETAEGYQKNMLNVLTKLGEPYDEINLWFEFDLHCQANLLGIMTYLSKQTNLSEPAVYLICPGEYPGKADFRGMGELNGEELEYLYDNIRSRLSQMDFIIAVEAWNIYASRNADLLSDYLNKTTFWASLHLLKPALQAQLKRLQVNDKGLNHIEQTLLNIYNSGITTKTEIHSAFWQTEKIYGMGDLEIDIYLSNLSAKGLISL
ncbi:DUF1835 domain-containing protein [Mucilaginibacter sp.]|uniref:DUF1835 domain-containing protein n=1 Tax=Mucilaginibacter sp. TaxID=1882438 RepID=UPI003D0EA4F3